MVLDDLCLAYGVFGLTNRPWCHVMTVSVTSKIEHINGLHTACMVILWKQIIDSSLSGMRLDFFSSVVLNGLLIIFSITLLVYQSPLFRRSNPVAVIEEYKSVIDSTRIISHPTINMQTLDESVDISAATSLSAVGLTLAQVQAKRLYHEKQMGRQVVSFDTSGTEYWQKNWEPSYTCTTLERLGRSGDGGKWVCDPQHYLQLEDCVVYSIGSNGDFSFEEAVHAVAPACEIHTMDPAPPSDAVPEFLTYHEGRFGEALTLRTFMSQLGHTNVTLVKMDCEGCEFGALSLSAMPSEGSAIQQILFEIHFSGEPHKTHALFQVLHSLGYAIFSKEANLVGCGGVCFEFSVVHLDQQLDAL